MELTGRVIGAAIEVHRVLGPGLLERIYEDCLCFELKLRRVVFERQVPLDLNYKGIRIGRAYRIDILVEGRVVVEVKTVAKIEPVHWAQLLTYMRLSRCSTGLLLNFNVAALRKGIVRLVL